MPRPSARASCATVLLAAGAMAGVAAAQPPGARTYCNPVDLDYRYNFEQLDRGISYRSGADPVIVVHRGAYYLFSTIAGGYWRSTDLRDWRFVTPSRWPIEDVVAPAAVVVRDTLLLMQSSFDQRPILYSVAPERGRLEFYHRWLPPLPDFRPESLPGRPGVAGPWDPALFHDDETNRWYLYWGSSNVYPLFGIALEPSRRQPWIGQPTPLVRLDPARHGWERFGRDHRDTTTAPFIEGAWMTKHGARYYLQYGAPGTEYNVYATGTYVGASPLGPFTYASYNPVAYKPGGFVTGAGHGNTFQDLHGNWWLTGTPWVGLNWNFERRIALFPAAFDADGQLHATTRFGDLPHWLPTAHEPRRGATFTGWMLLSYRRGASASSARDSFPAANVTDEDPRTLWVAGENRAGEALTVDLGAQRDVKAVQVNYADFRQGLYATDSTVYTRFRLLASRDGRTWAQVADVGAGERRDRPNAYVELARPVRARWVRYEHGYTAGAHLAISDLRVFGNADGAPPRTPTGVRARRAADARDASVSWRAVAGAVGYNVLWGIAPDRLYQTYQLWADHGTTLELRALTVGQPYWFAVEAFDERGVSAASAPVRVP